MRCETLGVGSKLRAILQAIVGGNAKEQRKKAGELISLLERSAR